MNNKTLFTWLGMTDLRASRGELSDGGLGPIGEAVEKLDFSEIHILSDMDKSANFAYSEWVSKLTSMKIVIHPCTLSSPMNFSDIYEATVAVLEEVLNSSKDTTEKNSHTNELTNYPTSKCVFHISPGTSAMAAIWIILAKTAYPAELIQSSPEEGVKTVSIPFDISADYNPAVLFGKNEDILRISQGLPPKAPEFNDIIYRCAAMKEAVMRSRIVAMHEMPVLINGESGTGKELFARAIHASSLRKGGPFVEVNCGAVPKNLFESEFFGYEKGAFTGANTAKKGYFEEADGGTLFLDEIGELPLQAQVKLLRVLQEKKVSRVGSRKSQAVDFRIVCATHKNLMKAVSEGEFREDLFHRIAIGVLQLPPLRERQGDLSLLIDHFIDEINCEFRKVHGDAWKNRKLSAGARNALLHHSWPGNIRELRNTVSRLILWSMHETISVKEVKGAIFANFADDKPEKGGLYSAERVAEPGFSLEKFLGEIAVEHIEKALIECNGRKSAAAKMLGFANYQTMDNWLRKFSRMKENK